MSKLPTSPLVDILMITPAELPASNAEVSENVHDTATETVYPSVPQDVDISRPPGQVDAQPFPLSVASSAPSSVSLRLPPAVAPSPMEDVHVQSDEAHKTDTSASALGHSS
eukprot:GFKZ01008406.1.p4 GENE.GFKZ01008406.1~~GFKZ01008406.1.p4  ORF type:complete len:111 (+),score=17.21 GFKZ01008406.1:220-552(+)